MITVKQLSNAPSRWWLVARTAMCPRIAASSLRIALLVGLVLNLINQGGPLWNGEPISFAHVLMNFFVPFCVSGYSAAKNELTRQTDRTGELNCIPAD